MHKIQYSLFFHNKNESSRGGNLDLSFSEWFSCKKKNKLKFHEIDIVS